MTRDTTPDELRELHPATAGLVRRFAEALAEKLRRAEQKYGYSDGWLSPDWQAECQQHLAEHVAKGDPRDVAAYAAFCWHHGWPTGAPALLDAQAEAERLRGENARLQGEAERGCACEGCGSTRSLPDLHSAGHVSCCPDRKMISAPEWQARAHAAQARADRLEGALRRQEQMLGNALFNSEQERPDIETLLRAMRSMQVQAIGALSPTQREGN